jgi:hypothetical protein
MQTEFCSTAFGPCKIEFTRTVDFEPPAYLFHELLEKVEENQSTLPIETTDAVISAVDLTRSSWTVVPIDALDEAETAVSANSVGGSSSNDFEFARLILQGAFTPIQLNATALDPVSGFSSSNVVRAVQALAQKLALGAHQRSRSLVGRPLSPAELASESLAMQRVMMSNHFINVLAWQRLQELLATSTTDVDALSRSQERGAAAEQVPLPASNDFTDFKPSVSPWDSEYDDCFISCPEELGNPLYDQLAKHFTGMTSKRSVSTGQQTDDSLRRRCAGVIPITSPYADVVKTTAALPQDFLAKISEKLSSRLASLRDSKQGASVWEIIIQSNGATVDTMYVPDAEGEQVSLGRDQVGFSSSSRAFISASLGTFTDHPKLVSPLHLILSTSKRNTDGPSSEGVGSTNLNITACGRNGIRILGRRHLLAGQSFTYPASSQNATQPLRVNVTPDLSILVRFRVASSDFSAASLDEH